MKYFFEKKNQNAFETEVEQLRQLQWNLFNFENFLTCHNRCQNLHFLLWGPFNSLSRLQIAFYLKIEWFIPVKTFQNLSKNKFLQNGQKWKFSLEKNSECFWDRSWTVETIKVKFVQFWKNCESTFRQNWCHIFYNSTLFNFNRIFIKNWTILLLQTISKISRRIFRKWTQNQYFLRRKLQNHSWV